MKNIAVSPFEKLRLFLCGFFLIFTLGAISVQGGTITKTLGGTVYSDYYGGTPLPGATVVLKIGSGYGFYNRSYEYRRFVTDASGYYSTTKDFDCSPGILEGNAFVLLDSGFYQNGQGGGGALGCDDEGDYSHSYNVLVTSPAKNNLQNAGDTCRRQSVGKPVNVTNGNMWLKQTDYNLPGIGENISINRTYNSMIHAVGIFGFGWTSEYDETIYNTDNNIIRLKLENGQFVYFGLTANNVFVAITPDFYGQLTVNTDDTYTITFKDGRVHQFGPTGKLLWQKDRNGNQRL